MTIAISVLVALIYYLVVGAIIFKFALGRKKLSKRLSKKNMQKLIVDYKIDLCWWDKLKFETVEIKSFDNLKLVGHYYNAESKKTVILVHGYSANWKEMQQYAKFFYQKDFNILAVENRAHGESEGSCIGMGYLDRKDILSWIDFLNKTNSSRILLFGLSMGGSAVCFTSGESLPNNVVGIISDCAFDNVERQFKHILKKFSFLRRVLLKHLKSYAKRLYDFDIAQADVNKAVKKTKVPILYIHGLADDYVPAENLTNLYNSTSENLRDKFFVEGAGHAMSYPVAGLEYERKLESFFKKFHLFD